MAIDPSNPSVIVVGSNTNYSSPVGGTFPTAYFSSRDGGHSFYSSTVPVQSPFTTGADPTVAADEHGIMYYSYLGETPNVCSGGRSAVMLSRSADHGRTFNSPVVVDVSSADDKPFLSVGAGSGPRRLYLTWTRWHDRGSEIWFALSSTGGRTFSRPRSLYSSGLDNFGPQIVSAPGGYVYAFWSEFPETALTVVAPTRILMRTSRDNGTHFGPVRQAVRWFSSIPRMSQPGSLRNLTMPSVASDRTGTLYMSWAQVTRKISGGAVEANIVVSRSLNHGATWSAPIRVNDSTRSDRFMPVLAVLGKESVGVAFLDRRSSPWYFDVFAVHVSYRAGRAAASRNVLVSSSHSLVSRLHYYPPGSICFSPGRFFGDYLGATACGSAHLCIAWTGAQIDVPDETQIWFARVALR